MPGPIQININNILREKLPNRRLPQGIIRYLERISHAKELNEFMATHTDTQGLVLLREYISEGLNCSAELLDTNNMPASDKPLLFASNHPLGGLDGILLATHIAQLRQRPIKVIVNDLLMNISPIAEIFVPVNKVGKQSREYAIGQSQLWQSDNDILTFPAGACSRKHKMFDPSLSSVKDLEWKPSFIRHAIQTHRDIVPIYFEGLNSRFFYNLAYWRKILHIKANIEMLYLADEMYRQKGTHFKAWIRKTIPYQTLDKSHTAIEWAEYIKEQVYHGRNNCTY